MSQVYGQSPLGIEIGFGINSAVCSVGKMGSQQRFDYCVPGCGVDLAARLKGHRRQI